MSTRKIVDYYNRTAVWNPMRIDRHHDVMNNIELLSWPDKSLQSYVECGLVDEDDQVIVREIERRERL